MAPLLSVSVCPWQTSEGVPQGLRELAPVERARQPRVQRLWKTVTADYLRPVRGERPRNPLPIGRGRVNTYYNASTQQEALARYYQRDGFMAENVEWIDEHAVGPSPKLIIWAHDGHIANDTTYGSQDGRNMGGELRTHHQDRYLPIGTTLYQGTFRVYNYPSGIVQTIPPAPSDTYNYALGQAGLPLYMLGLRTASSGAVADWANGTGSATRLINYGLGGEDPPQAPTGHPGGRPVGAKDSYKRAPYRRTRPFQAKT
jgi:hypothetical protein